MSATEASATPQRRIDKGVDVLHQVAAPLESPLPLPRLLVVLAHPDDEVLALGGRLERFRHSRFLTVTDGAPLDGADAQHHGFDSLEAYRSARRKELLCALEHAGLTAEVAPTFAAAVPDQQAGFHLPQLVQAIAAQIDAFRPTAVLTHPYEGGHPDHDACAFAVHLAIRSRSTEADLPLLEAPFYHAGKHGMMVTGGFLTSVPSHRTITVNLSSVEQQRKHERLACFRSQAETLAQFGLQQETFRLAPTYDFLRPPHEGQLLYEHFSWGMTAPQFIRLARQAATEAGLYIRAGQP